MKTFILPKNDTEAAGDMVAHVFDKLTNDLVVTVKAKGEARKDSQRALGNIWYNDAAASTGEDRTTIRNRVFYLFAVPIFYRDQIIVNGINSFDTLSAIYELKERGMKAEYDVMIKSFVSLSTTNSFLIKQNSEYLNNVWNYCLNNNIFLSLPGDADIAGFKP